MSAPKMAQAPPDPHGRIDVLLFRLAERGTKQLETRLKMPGLWDDIAPWIESAITEAIPAKSMLNAPKPKRRLG